MKQLLICVGILVAATASLSAQQKPPASPPATAMATLAGKSITITYNSPRVKGREGHVFTSDGLIATAHGSQYPIWRGGANAATTLMTNADLRIGDLSVPKGTYTLFIDISNPDQWNLIVNKKTGEWGLAYDKSADLGQVKMDMSKPPAMVEDLKYTITDLGGTQGKIALEWENKVASVPISVQ
ncbi:MAG: DUF2911 domain-containing protein [Terracidiphilus sp.]